MPRGNCQERLHRKVELGAKTTTDRRGNDAHLFRSNPENDCDVAAIHVRSLGACLNLDPVANAASEASLRLDVGVFHKAGFALHLRHDFGARQRVIDVPAHNPTTRQDIFRPAVVNQAVFRGQCGIDLGDVWEWFPEYGKLRQLQGLYGNRFAHDGSDRFAAMACFLLGKYRLVCKLGDYAVAILPRYVFCGKHRLNSGMLANETGKISEPKTRTVMRAANHPN